MKKIILAVLLFSAPGVAPGQSVETRAQTIVHLLDYISVDYPEFVKGGKVLDEAEYQEQLEFSSQVVAPLQSLPDVAAKQELLAKAQTLKAKITEKAAGKQVSSLANELRWDVIRAYDIAVVPKIAPDLSQAAAIYTAACAGCHGVEGRSLKVSTQPRPIFMTKSAWRAAASMACTARSVWASRELPCADSVSSPKTIAGCSRSTSRASVFPSRK